MGRKRSPATWTEAARTLHSLDPKLYNQSALARIFRRNNGTVFWALHPELYVEHQKDKYLKDKEEYDRRAREYYATHKNDPKYRARRAANTKRYRERQKAAMEQGTHKSVLYPNFGPKYEEEYEQSRDVDC